MLSKSDFKTVVESTPLVSIDLVIKNNVGKILVGKRVNRPAKGVWFVPGGRVRKNESLECAFWRLVQTELGEFDGKTSFIGVYQHFYDDNFSGKNFGTHYVVLAYEVELDIELSNLPKDQHSDYKWLFPEQILEDNSIHNHTKWYFQKNAQADYCLSC